MSEAFRCDGCDRFFGGRPAATIEVGPQHGMRDPLVIGHNPGVDDAHPRKDLTEEVEWPYVTSSAEFCVVCTARHIVPGVLDAAQNGRFGDEVTP